MRHLINALLHRMGMSRLARRRSVLRPLDEFGGALAKLNYRGRELFVSTYDDRVYFISIEAQGRKVDYLKRVCEAEGGDVDFYDVGANYGEFTLPLLGLTRRVRCFEPNPIVFFCLRRTLQDDLSAELNNCALTARGGHIALAINPFASGGSSVDRNVWDRLAGGHSLSGEKNQLVYMDVAARQLGGILNEELSAGRMRESLLLMKIDVEGVELDLLEEAAASLERVPRFLLFFESNLQDRSTAYAQRLARIVAASRGSLYGFCSDGSISRAEIASPDRLLADPRVTELILTNTALPA